MQDGFLARHRPRASCQTTSGRCPACGSTDYSSAEGMVEHLIKTTQGKGVINTAFIERLIASFRQPINSLTRRTRTLAQRSETLAAGMSIVGC